MRSETAEAVTRSQRPSGGAPLAPLLNAYGGPNHERSSPPLLTVLLLLTAEHQQEGGWVEKTRGRDLWGENPGVFFWSPPLVLALGYSGVFW